MATLDTLLKEELSEGTLAALQEFLRAQRLGESEESEEEEGRGEQAPGRQGPNTGATLDPLSSTPNATNNNNNSNNNSTNAQGTPGHPAAATQQEEAAASSRGASSPQDPKPADVTPGGDVSPGPQGDVRGLAREEARFRENWGLSQFWYEDATAEAVALEVLRVSAAPGAPGAAGAPAGGTSTPEGSPEGGPVGADESAPERGPEGGPEGVTRLPVACIACPTLFRRLRRKLPPSEAPQLHLLEYDRRFADFGASFTFYDYRNPEAIPDALLHRFPIVVADPPYLSEECLEKTAVTMRLLAQEPKEGDPASAPKLLLLTGAVQEPLARELLGLRPCEFRPEHRSKLGNDFRLFTNYEPEGALGGWEPEDKK